jgi:hypothetical protein
MRILLALLLSVSWAFGVSSNHVIHPGINTIDAGITIVNALEAVSNQPQRLELRPGIYTNIAYVVPNNNISIVGAGAQCTFWYGSNGSPGSPLAMMQLGDNQLIAGITFINLATNGYSAIFDTSTLLSVTNCIIDSISVPLGGTDIFYASGGPLVEGLVDTRHRVWVRNSYLRSQWDVIYMGSQSDEQGAPVEWRVSNCELIAAGPSTWAYVGESSLIKVLGQHAALTIDNSRLVVSGATNMLTGAQILEGAELTYSSSTISLDTNGLVAGGRWFDLYAADASAEIRSRLTLFNTAVTRCYSTNANFLTPNGYRSIWNRTNTTGNVGTGEDDLHTNIVSAYSLFSPGQSLNFRASGSTATNSNQKRWRVRLGAPSAGSGVAVFDSGAMNFNQGQSRNNGFWEIDGRIIWSGNTNAKAMVRFTSSSSVIPAHTYYTNLSIGWSTNLVWRVTGEATANNDIVCEMSSGEWRGSP